MGAEGEGLTGRRRWLPLAVAAALLTAVVWLLPRAVPDPSGVPAATDPSGPGPFGPMLPGALAYVGTDRVLHLVDLGDGSSLGSKAIPGDRRPAAVSATHAYLGRLSPRPGDTNWDYWRELPWEGTMYRDVGPGSWLALVPEHGVVIAGTPLADGTNGVRSADGARMASSAGRWGALAAAGDRVLARELAGPEARWWLLEPDAAPIPVSLPSDFRPVAAAAHRVAGTSGGTGLIVTFETGTATPVQGPLGAAAEWDAGGVLLAVATEAPPELWVYRSDGSVWWQRELSAPASAQRGGVSWSPDGSFLVVAEGGTLVAYRRDGERIGSFDPLQPRPQLAAAWLRVVERAEP